MARLYTARGSQVGSSQCSRQLVVVQFAVERDCDWLVCQVRARDAARRYTDNNREHHRQRSVTRSHSTLNEWNGENNEHMWIRRRAADGVQRKEREESHRHVVWRDSRANEEPALSPPWPVTTTSAVLLVATASEARWRQMANELVAVILRSLHFCLHAAGQC